MPNAGEPERDSTVAGLLDGSADRTLRLFGARALLPLGVDEKVRILFACRKDPEAEIASEAAASLEKIAPEEWLSFLDVGKPSAEEIEAIASATRDPFVLEQLVRHRETPDTVLVRIARTAPAPVLEALVVNQRRLLAHPPIIDAAERNVALPPDCRRVLAEIREEFFEKRARRSARVAEESRETEPEKEEEGGEEQPEADEAGEAEGEESAEAVARRMALHQRIAYMTASEKIETAMKGNREERRVLITDVNKSVWEAVLKCPFLTDVELEMFASMRNVDEGVFRQMSLKPDWMRKYGVILALVKNPVVPVEISMALVKFLRMRDLKLAMNDRNLPDGVRVTARKLYLIRRS